MMKQLLIISLSLISLLGVLGNYLQIRAHISKLTFVSKKKINTNPYTFWYTALPFASSTIYLHSI